MTEPTYKQYKILKEINENSRQGFNNEDLTENHWGLVRTGYVRNLVSLGVYQWVFELTEKGIEFLEKTEEL